MTAAGDLTVPPLFNGPPDSANGGYLAGILAGRVAAPAAAIVITLRKPPPLAAPMAVTGLPDGGLQLHHGDDLVAEAAPSRLAGLGRAPRVPFDEATAAEARYRGHHRHPFPTCFVCGPGRGERYGMRLFPGSVDTDTELFACTWTPPESLADRPEFVWAALDCPGAWTIDLTNRAVVLGRITATVEATPSAGEPCVVTSRPVGRDGRKFTSCSAAYGADGRLLGEAESVWIELRATT